MTLLAPITPDRAEDDTDKHFTLSRIEEGLDLAQELACSQGEDKRLTLCVRLSQNGAVTELVGVSIEDWPAE